MDKEYFRFYIKVRTSLHIGPIVIHNEFGTLFGDGREDEARVGRPITETTAENIRHV